MSESNLKVEYIDINNLIPYVNNCRIHSEIQIGQIVDSIQEFGFCNPILIDEHNHIIAGHGRLLAAQKLNFPTIPCIRLIGLTEIQQKAYVIADNKLALNADWDLELLKFEIGSLQEEDFDLSIIGFDDNELKNIGIEDDFITKSENGSIKDIVDEQKNILMIEFDSEYQLQQAYETYSGKGFKCKIIE